jgi:NCAIR mutase (PurE)-related protein
MDKYDIKQLLQSVASGHVSVEEAILKLKMKPFEDLGFAKIDYHRALRQGVAEIIFGAGKTPLQIKDIALAMHRQENSAILITRLSEEAAGYIKEYLPLTYHEIAKIGIIGDIPEPDGHGKIVIATGGTSDIFVAEEAALTAEVLGNKVKRLYDVGVAGIHRVLNYTEDIMEAKVIIAIAGMEGALASVIGGLSDCPVIAVPTSIGYGTSFGGIAALLSMLNSCASGISVVNIDNGFGAAYQASMINHLEVN